MGINDVSTHACPLAGTCLTRNRFGWQRSFRSTNCRRRLRFGRGVYLVAWTSMDTELHDDNGQGRKSVGGWRCAGHCHLLAPRPGNEPGIPGTGIR